MTDSERIQQLEQRLQHLTDRAEITELVHRYGAAADSRDWNSMRSMFTDEIEVWLGRHGQSPQLRRVSADRFTGSGDKILGRFSITQHVLTDKHIEIIGDEAICICDMQARHFKKPEDPDQKIWDIGGFYSFYLTRTAQGWKVRKYTLNITWSENPPSDIKI